LYIAIQLVAEGVLGGALAESASAPLADATARFLGSAGQATMLLAAVCSMFGYLSGDMLSSPRNWYALARDGFLPAVFARIDPTWRTPKNAIWAHAALATLFASVSTFQSLAIISNVGLLILYLLCCGAALELARRDVRDEGRPFDWPGTPCRSHPWRADHAVDPFNRDAYRAGLYGARTRPGHRPLCRPEA
jgi:APA family basic amino acid/polyamine antiporter